jgi:putative serine/threonine protein kinase
LKEPTNVFTEDLKAEPYSSILCYPRTSDAELQSRITELKTLGVEAIEFSGKGSAFNIPVLGKGYVGIVVKARLEGDRAALKIRRIDADRANLQHEAEMLAKANTVHVGPMLITQSKNFLLMQLIEGDMLPVWLETHKKKEVMRKVLADIMEQCWRLDTIGLDHGELSKAPKHLIVDEANRPWILDFEAASDARKPANVTAVCQYLFVGASPVTTAVGNSLGERNRSGIVEALRFYKKDKSSESFDRVQQICLR